MSQSLKNTRAGQSLKSTFYEAVSDFKTRHYLVYNKLILVEIVL